ncbi:glycosyltransferase [Arthrobacter sp. H5]|uniref:glycosyltransferase family protein n=1 Tax=Arthrobacter sp. H5 TaxID=1267973 RepID=UPI0009DD664A|nr:glycosyltransferase [Arthrobacter sp. H5]
MASNGTKELRIVLYSHDSQGLGHTRRNLALAHALARSLPEATGRVVSGLLVTGESTATRFEAPDGWDWVVLPGIRKGSDGYLPRNLAIKQKKLIRLRSQIMNAVLREFEPHLVVVDRHAFGVDRELTKALSRLREDRPKCKVVLGLREVLDSPQVAQREWRELGDLRQLRRCFDELWVYGDPAVHNPVTTGEIPADLAHLVRFTGYLSAGRPARRRTSGASKPYLLTMAGGGSDGLAITLTAARATVPHGYQHIIVTGPQMPKEHRAQVEDAAGPRTEVLGSVRDALAEIKDASAIVSMGGYNTVCEIMSTNTPALIVPRTHPRREQLIRAASLAKHNLLDICHPDQFTADALSRWFESVAGTVVSRAGIQLDGLETACRYATLLLSEFNAAPNTAAHHTDWHSHAAV